MTEHQQKTLNAFGESLNAIMAEKGIADVPELVERMRQHPSYREEFTENYIANLVTMTDIDHYPEDDVDMVLFYVLKQEEVLDLSDEEVRTKLLDPFYRTIGLILDQRDRREATMELARFLEEHMQAKGVEGLPDLATRMREHAGYDLTVQEIEDILTYREPTPSKFLYAAPVALGLSEEETTRMMWAWLEDGKNEVLMRRVREASEE